MPDSVSNYIYRSFRRVWRQRFAVGALLIVTLLSAATHSQELGFAIGAGGTEDDLGLGVAVDASGNVYTTGYFRQTADFDPGAGTEEHTSAGENDIFVQKLDANGALVWVRCIGGTSYDRGWSIALDASGNVYVTGSFRNTVDFDPGAGTENLSGPGGNDGIFVLKLDSDGDFVWAKALEGSGFGVANDLALDASGSVHVTGQFVGTVDFDPGAGTATIVNSGEDGIFVFKLDTLGNYVWAKDMTGANLSSGRGVAVDSSGNVVITGYYEDTIDFDPGAGTANLTSVDGSDIFVLKLDVNGDYVWAKSVGGTQSEGGYDIAFDPSGNVHTVGEFSDSVDFDPGAGTATRTANTLSDIFILSLDSNGDYVRVTTLGSDNNGDTAHGIAVDAAGNAVVTGEFRGTVDFDPGAGTADFTSAGVDDIFVVKLDNTGALVWAQALGGSFTDRGWAVAVDGTGNAYVTGIFGGTVDFDPGAGTANLTTAGQDDYFALKLTPPDTDAPMPTRSRRPRPVPPMRTASISR